MAQGMGAVPELAFAAQGMGAVLGRASGAPVSAVPVPVQASPAPGMDLQPELPARVLVPGLVQVFPASVQASPARVLVPVLVQASPARVLVPGLVQVFPASVQASPAPVQASPAPGMDLQPELPARVLVQASGAQASAVPVLVQASGAQASAVPVLVQASPAPDMDPPPAVLAPGTGMQSAPVVRGSGS